MQQRCLCLSGRVTCKHVLQDDEYVVYSPDQVKLKYVVQFSVGGDELKEFSPSINTSAELCPPSAGRGEYCTQAGYIN